DAFDEKEDPVLAQRGLCRALNVLKAGLLGGHGNAPELDPRPGYNTLAGRRGTAGVRRSRPEAFAVQTLVEIGEVLAVAVEQERRPPLAGADDLFTRLAPARMRHLRIDVGPEAIFRRLQCFPHALRALVGETETHDRLDRLEAVLPRQGEPQRRAVLPC